MRSIIIPYVSRHCGLLNEISRVCRSFWYTPVRAVMNSTGPEIFITAFFFPHLLVASFMLCNSGSLMPVTPCTNRCVPIWCLLSLLLFLVPFSHHFSLLLSIPLCGCPEPQLLHQDSKRDRKKWRNNVLQMSTQLVDFCGSTSISLLFHPATGPCLPAHHPLPSILVQIQQSIICFLSLRHWQHVTCQNVSNSSCYLSRLVVSPSLCVIANMRCPRLYSVSFTFCSVFWRCIHLLNSCWCKFWR